MCSSSFLKNTFFLLEKWKRIARVGEDQKKMNPTVRQTVAEGGHQVRRE
jgi:hypothetical protein